MFIEERVVIMPRKQFDNNCEKVLDAIDDLVDTDCDGATWQEKADALEKIIENRGGLESTKLEEFLGWVDEIFPK